jgi:hypothetical protein
MAAADIASKPVELTAAALARISFEAKVPSDITISQSVEPFHIAKVAAAAGILEHELEPYGSNKGKVKFYGRLVYHTRCHNSRCYPHRSNWMF